MPGTRILLSNEMILASKNNNKLKNNGNSVSSSSQLNTGNVQSINLLDSLGNIFAPSETNNILGSGVNLLGDNFKFDTNNNNINDLFSSVNSVI